MKRLITKVRSFLDKEYEITLPVGRSKKQQYVKKQTGYVNPFKHQQELEQQRLLEIRQKQIEAIKKLQHEQELKRMRESLRKPEPVKQVPSQPQPQHAPPPPPVKHVEPIKKPELVHHSAPIHHPQPIPPGQPVHAPLPKVESPKVAESKTFDPTQLAYKEDQRPEKTSKVDKKIEININFPKVKAPKIKTPHIKKPQIKLPTTALKKSFQATTKYKQPLALAGVVLLGTAVIGNAIIKFQQQPQKDVKAITTNTTQQAPVDKKTKIIESISKRIELPTNEVPVLATVEDVEKLKGQDFFKEARNGDKILMYRSNGKAYLYRPSTDEVLVQAPLVYQDEQELVATGSGSQSTNGEPIEYVPHGKMLIEPREDSSKQ